jgi:predicted RNA-binding Zn-ribbon protein involved in translation (DUF1610 family)
MSRPPSVPDPLPPPPRAPPPSDAEDRDAAAAARRDASFAFPCDNCGAEMVWDPDADALLCGHCDHRRAVPRLEGTIVEHALDEARTLERGFGCELRVAQCKQCGARVTFDSSATSESCVFCGAPTVLAQEARRNALRPESILPLDVGRAAVDAHFRKWTRGLWFRPNALKRVTKFGATGVYVPCWTFDAAVHSNWTADAGYYYYVTVMMPVTVNGRTTMQPRQVRKIRWEPAAGARDDAYDDVIVHASGWLKRELADALGPYDRTGLVPYRPEYLAGWHAEEYQLDLLQAWEVAQLEIRDTQERRCAGDVPGDTQRDLRVQNVIRDVRWKHILLPLWTLTYRFGAKSYTVLIHGQTGRVHGEAPLSWVKILLAILVAALCVLAIVAAANA